LIVLEKHTMSCGLNILRYYSRFVFHDFQFACIELTLMTQGIQPMVWHQFEGRYEGTIIRFSIKR
jgi:hypothetical protein